MSFLFETVLSGYIPFLPYKDPSLLEFLNAQHCCEHPFSPTEYISFSSPERHFIILEWKERMSCHWKESEIVYCFLPVPQILRLEGWWIRLSCIYHSSMSQKQRVSALMKQSDMPGNLVLDRHNSKQSVARKVRTRERRPRQRGNSRW